MFKSISVYEIYMVFMMKNVIKWRNECWVCGRMVCLVWKIILLTKWRCHQCNAGRSCVRTREDRASLAESYSACDLWKIFWRMNYLFPHPPQLICPTFKVSVFLILSVFQVVFSDPVTFSSFATKLGKLKATQTEHNKYSKSTPNIHSALHFNTPCKVTEDWMQF